MTQLDFPYKRSGQVIRYHIIDHVACSQSVCLERHSQAVSVDTAEATIHHFLFVLLWL